MKSIFPVSEKYLACTAILSRDGFYRYSLTRLWEGEERKRFVVIGLNPSTADASKDDQTIRKCVSFAEIFGCNELVMLNLFAWRATDPKALRRLREAVVIGPENDGYIMGYLVEEVPSVFLAAWGNHGSLHDRDKGVMEIAEETDVKLMCLGKNGNGSPRHPLYVPLDTKLEVYY